MPIALSPISYVEEAQRWLSVKEEGGDKGEGGDKKASHERSRILLADDNGDMRDYIQRLLSSRYIVEAVADGMAALNTIRENPPDLVLSDVMMPKMDGFELLRSLRSDLKTQEIPIILLSARAGEESRIEGLTAGADDYLIKPFSARELLARVESSLKLAKLRQTTQTLHTEAETAKANLESVLANLEDGFVTLDRNWCFTYINDRQAQIWGIRREEAIGNLEGYFTQLNPAWERTLGFSETELKAKPYIEFVHPDDRAATLLEAEKLPQEYQTIGFENRYLTKDGFYRWLSWDVVSLPGQNVFYAAAHDISARKLAELAREQLLVREQAAREAAENANRVKDEFLTVLSHELRTPLNPILGWSKLLQMGKLNAAKSIEAIAIIERNAKLQVQLIDDLLDISRILRGKMSLTVMPVNLATVIAAALETVRLAAEAKEVQIQYTTANAVGTVNGDPGRLQQVVWNLLSNAVKFTPKGGQITVNLTQVKTNVQIQVKDTGKGINPDFLPYVFEHFRQEDGATTRQFGGLGLGLAIARQIVEMHGGTVMADSPGEGLGATFTVQIPLFRPFEEIKKDSSPKSAVNLSGVKVLLVDDDADSREFISFILEQEQAIVTTVASGFEALQVIEQAIPDIVVSDIGMPEMNGYMLMHQLRMRTASIGGIEAIALTAYAGELNQQQALAAGFQRHLPKPVEIDELIQAIAILVGMGHGA